MTNKDYDIITILKKDIMMNLSRMLIARYEYDFEEAHQYVLEDIKKYADIIYNDRYKKYHDQEEEDE